MVQLLTNRTELFLHQAPAGRWLEVGVERAESARLMALRRDITELWLVDCWGPYPGADPRDPSVLTTGKGQEVYKYVCRMFAKDPRIRIVRSQIEWAARGFPREWFNFVYLDAAHTYDAVLNHLHLLWPLVCPGGLLCGHDYANADPYPWIEVKAAVDKFCESKNLVLAFLTTEACGSFAIRKS